jgi:uncharacterized repeat protein (TIGR02543 family)
MTGQAQRQARQYRQEEKETLGISFPSSFGTILITPWLQALAQAPQWIQGKSGVILIMVCSSLESWKMGEWRPQGAPAQPEPAAYTVAFDSRGGSAVEALQNVTQGARIAEPSSPVREGYTFEGWYRDAARTDAWDFAADTVEQDTILYAKWEAVPAQDTTSGAALPQTGVATGALLWACVLAAALALAAAAALLLRRAYRG